MRAHDGARGGLPRSVTMITKRNLRDRSTARNGAAARGEMTLASLLLFGLFARVPRDARRSRDVVALARAQRDGAARAGRIPLGFPSAPAPHGLTWQHGE